ncbi:MAG: response regulator transcription factor [Blastocatellia bacterium]
MGDSDPTARCEKKVTVLLVSKQPVMCEGLRMLINQHPALSVVGVAIEIEEAHLSLVNQRPDVIVLDIDLNSDFGFDRIPELLKINEGAPVLALVSAHLLGAEHKAMHFGAAGVVFREQTPQIFIKALERVSGGEYWFSRSMMTNLLQQASHSELAKINKLTKRERQVVDLVAKALKNQEIAEHLSISEATVRHHLTSIFQKLHVSDRHQLIVYSYEHLLAYPKL